MAGASAAVEGGRREEMTLRGVTKDKVRKGY